MRAKIASTYYGKLGMEESDIFVSDGAKSDISRLQVWLSLLTRLAYVLDLLGTFDTAFGVITPLVILTSGFNYTCPFCSPPQVLFGSGVTMAVQDPSYPVST